MGVVSPVWNFFKIRPLGVHMWAKKYFGLNINSPNCVNDLKET